MPFPMGKGHLLPWGIRGHPLTRSMHLYIQNAYLAKALRLFLSLLWEKIPEVGQGKCPGSGIEKQAKIPEVG